MVIVMNRILGSFFFLTIVVMTAFGQGRQPNIVLVVIDDYGWADTGCYGSTYHQTPAIDGLAARGMRFTDGYATAPVCSPTRASLMTGKYPARLNLTDWLPGRPDLPAQRLARPIIRQELPLGEVTLAEVLKGAGYVTAHIGKWHLGGAGFEPEKQGFDLNIAGDHTGTPLSYFAPFRREAPDGIRYMPGLETAAPGEYLPDRLTTEAERFMEDNRNRPFFLYLPHYSVHIPMKAKAELVAKYRALPQPQRGQNNPVYAAMVESMDESIGRLVRKLEQLGIGKDTVFVFTSDNGGLSVREGPDTPPTVNGPLRAGKGYLYEGGVRVPLIVTWPAKVRPGAIESTPVNSADIFATIVEIAGGKTPTGSNGRVDGESFLPLLTRHGGLKRRALFWHYPHYSNQSVNGGHTDQPGGAIRLGNYKLIEFFQEPRVELYDLKHDLGEEHDLSRSSPKMARLAESLRRRLAAWRRSVRAGMMTLNPGFVSDRRGD
jgi:arylsulfatase A-like enzyme